MGLKKHAENSSFLMLVNRIRRFVKHRTYNEYIWSYIFLAPAMAAFVVFLVYPAINTIIFSFQNFSIFNFGTSFCRSQKLPVIVQRSHLVDSGAQHHRFHLGDGALQGAGANVDRACPDEIEFNAANGFQDRVLHACRDLRGSDRSRLVVDLLPLSRGVGKRLGDFSRLAPTKLVRFQQDSYACNYFYGMDDRSRSCHYPLYGGSGWGAALIL